MTYAQALTALAVISIAATVATVIVLRRRNDGTRLSRWLPRATAIAWVLLATLGAVWPVAAAKGLWTANAPVLEVLKGATVEGIPLDGSAHAEADARAGKVVAFYRFGCPDCGALYGTIERWAKDNGLEVVWTSSRSERGRELFQKSGAGYVPSLMAMDRDGKIIATEVVYWNEDDGTPVFDEAAADRVADALKGLDG